jgi:hypothetical protein
VVVAEELQDALIDALADVAVRHVLGPVL